MLLTVLIYVGASLTLKCHLFSTQLPKCSTKCVRNGASIVNKMQSKREFNAISFTTSKPIKN